MCQGIPLQEDRDLLLWHAAKMKVLNLCVPRHIRILI